MKYKFYKTFFLIATITSIVSCSKKIDEAYQKTSELEADDFYDVVVGAWEECTPQTEEV
jgi:hypothetical protein